MDNLQETLTKEIQDRKLKQEEMQNTVTEIKKSPEAANSRIQEAEEQISKVEDRFVEITDAEQKREKKTENKRRESQRTLGQHETLQHPYYRGARRRREKGTENIFQEITAENLPNMGEEPLTQIQEAQREPYKINPRRNTPRHILIKLTKMKDKEKILKAAREKKQVTYKGNLI